MPGVGGDDRAEPGDVRSPQVDPVRLSTQSGPHRLALKGIESL
ncbi:MAG: hypothetical protein ACT4QB_14600 [Gammaproteobacteria bacterium]